MIRSTDPRQHPRIFANYLATKFDRRVLIEGLKLARKISQAPSFAKYVEGEGEPGLDNTDDEALMAHIRARGTTIFHPPRPAAWEPTTAPWSTSGCGCAG